MFLYYYRIKEKYICKYAILGCAFLGLYAGCRDGRAANAADCRSVLWEFNSLSLHHVFFVDIIEFVFLFDIGWLLYQMVRRRIFFFSD